MKNLSIHGDHETILKARNFLVSKGVKEDEEWNRYVSVEIDPLPVYIITLSMSDVFALHNHPGVWNEDENPQYITVTPENYESVLTELINDGSITAGSKQ